MHGPLYQVVSLLVSALTTIVAFIGAYYIGHDAVKRYIVRGPLHSAFAVVVVGICIALAFVVARILFATTAYWYFRWVPGAT